MTPRPPSRKVELLSRFALNVLSVVAAILLLVFLASVFADPVNHEDLADRLGVVERRLEVVVCLQLAEDPTADVIAACQGTDG